MPIDYRDYHPDWRNISRQIREQAGNRCEFCGAPNGRIVIRNRRAPEQFHVVDDWAGEMAALDGEWVTKIILTVAHLDHDKTNNDPCNLRALCQRCHLNWDAEIHARNAAETRRERQIDAGQMAMVLS